MKSKINHLIANGLLVRAMVIVSVCLTLPLFGSFRGLDIPEAQAADLNLKWEASTGATGYKVYMSTDLGVSWLPAKDVGNVLTYTYLAVPDNALVIFRLGAYNAVGEQLTPDRGAWYDGRRSLPKTALHFGVM